MHSPLFDRDQEHRGRDGAIHRRDWNDEERRIALAQIMGLESRAFDSTTRLYWIDVKDEQGVRQLLTTADWNDDDRRIAIGQIFRLAGVPDDNCFTEPLLGLR